MSKYFKYAIGEILLVVIGILIALQINNWNEERKTLKKRDMYLSKIINDLKTDTLNIKDLIIKTERYSEQIKDYNTYFQKADTLNLTTEQLMDSITNLNIFYIKYYPVNQTFKDMEASGNSALLSDKQRDFLIKLATAQAEVEIINESYINLAVDELQKSKQLLGNPKNFFDKVQFKNSKQGKIQGLLHRHLFNQALDDWYRYAKVRGERIIKLSHEAILLLEND
ncbi:DUF6090 family protein [Winogradskyella alexanderae]|uniref:Uncharacterized protein n=1 Tax=Winogradskyella alexanderae TaxID=2877123 RepID=A0ABS7XUW6_9FLAO|nr:DUF6090 family protein [Winogradskyella alexanderae]MCA0133817.1 hypothetical protein [Winogradskyella alexanderae]